MIVRWGLEDLGGLLRELGIQRPLVVTSERFADVLHVPLQARFTAVRRHSPLETVSEAVEAADGVDGVVAIGGGSAIDTGKAVTVATGLGLVAVPTTYSGAEWTNYFGMRDGSRRLKTGGSGATIAAIVYEPRLTLGLPRAETVGTALNALAHAAEALYVRSRNADSDREALTGASLIGRWLPAVVERPSDLEARTQLLEGAMHAGRALGSTGLGLAHAIAQVLGGRYDLSHGAMNALSLAPALRFNEPVAAEQIARLAEALETEEAAARVEELAALGEFGRLREFGIPEVDLPLIAAEAAARPGARANPRSVQPEDVLGLLREMW